MSSDLEDAIVTALHAKAGTAPTPALPRLGAPAPRAPLGRRLAPVAAAVAMVVTVGAAVFVLTPGDDQPLTPPATTTSTAPSPDTLAPGEVYYSLRLSTVAEGVIRETQVWQPRDRAGQWRQAVAQGTTIKDGRVVPSGGAVGAPDGGVCYPATTGGAEACATPATWFNPTVDFLATAPRDPAVIRRELDTMATEAVEDAGQSSADYVPALEVRMIGELLAGNGVPRDLSSALREVVETMPGIVVTTGMRTVAGDQGTGYSISAPRVGPQTVIFDDDDQYLGSPKEAVYHGVAPGLGQPPSRMLD